jgi:transposase
MATSRKGSKCNQYKENENDRKLVIAFAAAGLPQKEIAKQIKLSYATLRKYYKAELEDSKNNVTAIAVSGLIKAINKGNVGAIKFWLNTQAGWSTKSNVDATVGTYDADKAKEEANEARVQLREIYGQEQQSKE